MIPMACNLQLPGFTPWPQCFLVQLAESDPWAHGHGLCRVYDRVLNRMPAFISIQHGERNA